MSKRKRSQPARSQPTRLNERQQGTVAFERKDYDGAISAWTGALRAQPSLAVAQALAEAYFRRACSSKIPARGLHDLQAACNLVPEDPVYLYHRGLAQHRLGNLPAAIADYRESLKRDPYNYARIAYTLCLALAESGGSPSSDPAWELLTPEQQDRFQPKDVDLIQAFDCLSKRRFDAAEPLLQRQLKQVPGLANYYLGVIARARGDLNKAFTYWLNAQKAGFDTPALKQNLLSAYVERAVQQADSPDLLETVKVALKLVPDLPPLVLLKQRAEFLAGNQAAESGDWQKALTHWKAARQARNVTRFPRELIANMALALERLGRWNDAADTWRELLRRRPRRGEKAWSAQHLVQLWRHIDTLYARAGHYDKSAETLRYAIKSQPDDLILRLALVKRLMENQNWRAAEAAVLRVLEMTPKQPEALALYAQIIDTGGDLDAMIEAWEQVAATPEPKQVHLAQNRLVPLYTERGSFYLSMEDFDSAASDYAKALQLAPQNTLLRARYGAALAKTMPERARAEFAKVDLSDDHAAFIVISAWHRAGDHDEAARWLDRTKPRPALLVQLGIDLLSESQDDHVTMIATYFEAASWQLSKEEGPGLLTAIGVAYAAQKRIAEAGDYARRALKLDPHFGPAHFNLGLWDAARGRRAASAEHLKAALAWARRIRRADIADGIEEAINLLEEGYPPSLSDILDTIDPDKQDVEMRRLMGDLSTRGNHVE
jgi:tetratricopeptide (TPR) repeat protein